MNYPAFKTKLTSFVSDFTADLDVIYNDGSLDINQKMDKFGEVALKYGFPLDDVVLA